MKKILYFAILALFVSCGSVPLKIDMPGKTESKQDCMSKCHGLKGQERANCNHKCQGK